MNARTVCLVSALALLPLAHAADKKEEGRYLAKPLKGDYYVYGGSIGDSTPPTEKDRKLSVMLTGPLAKDLFDHMGPDAKACGAAPDYRERGRGDLSCTWSKADGYACYFGIDVRTGKSTIGITC
ncbi:hypothetical protein SAMN05428966_10922 [Massilia sp. PDC64]|nr:hypothetical protein [Massilia sp. PDC64]SDE54087.1 hypothetical protein SAMN05428966_10922 [Massilia sp. PDC64]